MKDSDFFLRGIAVGFLTAVILLVGVAGCETTSRGAPQPVVIVEQEPAVAGPALWLALSARATLRSDVRAEDARYVCPTTAQIPSLLKFCEKARTKKYLPEGFDCDDIAREYRVNAALWSVGVWPSLPAALAVGTAIVRIDGEIIELGIPPSKGLHAMIVLRRADGVWILIEPTTAKWVKAEEAFYDGTIEFLSIYL